MTRSTTDPAVKKSVSFPGTLLAAAEVRAKSLGWTLSAYLQHLMRGDLRSKSPTVTVVAEVPPPYRTKKAEVRPLVTR